MKAVVLPEKSDRPLPFYLAMEEWVAKNLPAGDYFFAWVTDPTVIIGRNQDIETEVNLQYCKKNNISVVRRRSGGGCVYSDRNNIMLSFVTDSTDVNSTFKKYTERVASQLRKMGIAAEATGRNDIVVDGRKISGNAFYHLPGRSIVHGTMLYDTDVPNMLNAITPSRSKLESKQVRSVESRIVTAHSLRPEMTFNEFYESLTNGIADDELFLTPEQVEEIKAIEQGYHSDAWLYGDRVAASYTSTGRYDNVGEITASVLLDSAGKILKVKLSGDYFAMDSIENVLDGLQGIEPEYNKIRQAIESFDISTVIRGLTNDSLACLIDKNNQNINQ